LAQNLDACPAEVIGRYGSPARRRRSEHLRRIIGAAACDRIS
jgi:hypothetical protein